MLPLILFIIAVVGIIIGILFNIDDVVDYFIEDKKRNRFK